MPAAAAARLAAVDSHVCAGHAAASEAAAKDEPAAELQLLDDDEVKSFLVKGWHILEDTLVPEAVHDRIYAEGVEFLRDEAVLTAENVTSRIPAIKQVVSSPVVRGALQSLLGEGYALHPHTFLHSTFAGNDEDFHKGNVGPDAPAVCKLLCSS